EARLFGELYVARQFLRRSLAQRHARWALVRSLEEQALAVDLHDPLRHRDLAEAGAEAPAVADGARGVQHLDGHGLERLGAERVRPPQARAFDSDRPAHLVLASGQRLLDALFDVADG